MTVSTPAGYAQVHLYARNGETWIDIPNGYAALYDERKIVLSCVPNATCAEMIKIPGFRRWVVRSEPAPK